MYNTALYKTNCFSISAGPGWIASFEDDFNCRDFASIAIDTGSSVWGSSKDQLSETDEKGWATFGDFQPFCWCGPY